MTEIDVGFLVFFWGTASLAMAATLGQLQPSMKVSKIVFNSLLWPKAIAGIMKYNR